MSNLLTEWLKKKPFPKDKQVQIGRMVFHIPFDGKNYLMFKCRRCGFCCNNQRQGALLLSLGDIKRLTVFMGYPNMTKFLEAECVWAEVTEPKEVYPLIGLPPCKVRYAGYFLKRFKREDESTIEKPHRCRFLTAENLCSIQPVKPMVCRKFPYTVIKDDRGFLHACYVDVPWSQCRGFREKRHLKLKWLSGWVKPLTQSAEESIETMKMNLTQITEVKMVGSC